MDYRFAQCINNTSCSLRVRLQIVQEENDLMNTHFYKIHQACVDMNFTGCIEAEREELDGWRIANSRMQQMMFSMDEKTTAQAGVVDRKSK